MRHPIKISLILLFVACIAFGGVRCGGAARDLFTSTVPTWISAAWSLGETGEPNTLRVEDAEAWNGRMCHSTTVTLLNHGEDFAGLQIVNGCFTTLILHICAVQGNAQPNLPACEQEPFNTAYDNLEHLVIPEGGSATIETTENLSINIFYCSDEMVLGAQTPLECVGL